jgi:alpha-ketoglutarate-dependent 2,4-dichlorophenoxyacetate dioxygenase
VAVVAAIDLRYKPSPSELDDLISAQYQYGVLVFPDQELSDEQLVTFGSLLGPLQKMALTGDPNGHVINITNLDKTGQLLPPDHRLRHLAAANQLWHTDGSYMNVRNTVSLLYARMTPRSGGETEFCDMRMAYDALPPSLKSKVNTLVGAHSLTHSRKLTGFDSWTDEERSLLPPAVRRPLVHVHSGSGRSTLHLASHIESIVGMPTAESVPLLAELTSFSTSPQFVYQHHWKPKDLVIWDNLCTMHRGRPFDDLLEARDMRSVRVLETRETAPRPFVSGSAAL